MFKEILLPVDLQQTKLTTRAVSMAKDIAERHAAAITVITVIPDFGMPMVASFFPDDAMEEAAEEVRAELNRFIAEHFDDPQNIKSYVETGSPHKAIINYATKHAMDLIIIPARAMNISKALLGSVSMHVVERAPCSVMVVRP